MFQKRRGDRVQPIRTRNDRIAYIEGKGTYTAALEARAVTSARSHTLSDDGR
jgi:hypothetical protein